MSVDMHRRAEQRMATADALAAQGLSDEARKLYREAADCEAQVFADIPKLRPRTRGIVAVSVVSLYFKADAFAEAIRHGYQYLADAESPLPEFARTQIEDLLDEAKSQLKIRSMGQDLSIQRFAVSLKGDSVLSGLAPLDLLVMKLKQIENYVLRVGEWVANRPFRQRWQGDGQLLELYTPMVGGFSAGSFQFEVRIAAPAQPRLPLLEEERQLTPESVAESCFSIIETITNSTKSKLEDQVTDPQYREVFVKLVRSLLPDGKRVKEIEVRRIGAGSLATAVLTPDVRRTVQQYLPPKRPEEQARAPHIGVLRALDLDKGWIILAEAQQRTRLSIASDRIFDDVVGPLVNHRVRVEMEWSNQRRKFLVSDIVEATD